MPPVRPSQWSRLFDLSLSIIDQARDAAYDFGWTFGGGTALMIQIDHRESHDIDLFIDDPQLLPFLNPSSQDFVLDRWPDDYESDGSRVLKLIFDGLGEVDFICCGPITDASVSAFDICGRSVRVETPAEIVAKKVYYRGSRLQPRDMFDIAAVAQECGQSYVVDALKACGANRCTEALAVAEAMDPAFASNLMGQLMLRSHNRHLPVEAQSTTQTMLRVALGL